MIKIQKSKKGFWVQYIGNNGQILSVTEMFETKQSAKKNIKAMMKLFFTDKFEPILVKDCSLKIEKTFVL